jgi:hypothetical protein
MNECGIREEIKDKIVKEDVLFRVKGKGVEKQKKNWMVGEGGGKQNNLMVGEGERLESGNGEKKWRDWIVEGRERKGKIEWWGEERERLGRKNDEMEERS